MTQQYNRRPRRHPGDTVFGLLTIGHLAMTARTTCTWCYKSGLRDGSQYVVSLDELREHFDRTGKPMNSTGPGKRMIVRRARAHYADKHPEVTLPG